MNLQCPNCQKLLTVQEHYAGQLMKCPLCKENFTVPALPPGGGEPAPAFNSPPEPAFSSPPAPPPPAPDHYGLKTEPAPAFQGLGALSPPSPPPEPAFSTSPPAPASSPPGTPTTEPSRVPAPPPATGYSHTYSIWISDRVLRWVPPAGLGLIFFLLFFPWVGVYPGGVTAVTQNAFQAVWGGYSDVLDMKRVYPIITEDDVKKGKEVSNAPGFNVLLLFYIFPLFPLALLVTAAVAALPYVKVALPPQVQQVLPWRWAIVAGLNAILLLFLGLQLLLGFSLESNARTWIENRPEVRAEAVNNQQKSEAEAKRGEMLEWLQRTMWLRLVVILHLLATASAALVYWIEKRGPSQPLPRIDLQW